MRTQKHILVIAGLIGILAISSPALAVPVLQLDISPGTYDTATQTTVSTSSSFTLLALLDPSSQSTLFNNYYISAAVVPKLGPTGQDLGSFSFNGTSYSVTDDMVYGVPPIDTYSGGQVSDNQPSDGGDLGQHDIYETFFKEFRFKFSEDSWVDKYDAQTDETSPGILYVEAFTINTSGLLPGYEIHFDLYQKRFSRRRTCSDRFDIAQFAPFSHDAQSGGTPVPEPGTLMLLGTGLVGIAAWGRKKFHR